MKGKIDTLQGHSWMFKKKMEERYYKGINTGARSCLRTTWKKMLDLDCAILGHDAVSNVEMFKKETVVIALKAHVLVTKKVIALISLR